MTINFKLVKKFFDEKIGNLNNLKASNKSNVVEAMNSLKTSDIENNSGFMTRVDIQKNYSNLDEFKAFLASSSVPSYATLIYSLIIEGVGMTAIVQKTSNSYLAFILFGYSTNPVIWKYLAGNWTSSNL